MTRQLTCERCGNKTDAGAWLGFVYVGAECLDNDDMEYMDDQPHRLRDEGRNPDGTGESYAERNR